MNEIFLKSIVPFAGGVVALFLLAALLYRRIGRVMPVFVAYVGYCIAEGLMAAAVHRYVPRNYPAAYLVLSIIDLLFSMAVLVEIGGNVLRSNRIPAGGWIKGPAFLVCACTLLLWPLVRWSSLPHNVSLLMRTDLRFMQGSTIASTAAFLALLVWSGALKLRWPECELRVMMGMGLATLIAFVVLVAYTDGKYGHQYYWLDFLTPISCICVYLYWLHYFWLDPSATAKIEPLPAAMPSHPSCRPDIPAAPDSLDVPSFAGKGLWQPK